MDKLTEMMEALLSGAADCKKSNAKSVGSPSSAVVSPALHGTKRSHSDLLVSKPPAEMNNDAKKLKPPTTVHRTYTTLSKVHLATILTDWFKYDLQTGNFGTTDRQCKTKIVTVCRFAIMHCMSKEEKRCLTSAMPSLDSHSAYLQWDAEFKSAINTVHNKVMEKILSLEKKYLPEDKDITKRKMPHPPFVTSLAKRIGRIQQIMKKNA